MSFWLFWHFPKCIVMHMNISWRYASRSKIIGSYLLDIINIFPSVAAPFYIFTSNVYKTLFLLTDSTIKLYNVCQWGRCVALFTVLLFCISLITSEDEFIFLFIGHLVILFHVVPVPVFCQFFYLIFAFFLLICGNSLQILITRFLSFIIFHSVACFLHD